MEKAEAGKALKIGVLCITTYLVNYYLRHILSVLTPTLTEAGIFTKEYIGVLSSTYMVLYAAGQLVNGFLGDVISPKKLACSGIFIAGLASVIFPIFNVPTVNILSFAVLGFALSMVRGPLMKIISENTKPEHSRVICVFFSFASFAGPLIASLFALIKNWKWVFFLAGTVAIGAAVAAYIVLTVMENKKAITYNQAKGQGIGSLLNVFKIEKFAFYMFIACVVEICTTSISFWIPAFFADRLGFNEDQANMIFTAISVVRSVMPFAALALFKLTKGKDIQMLRITFFTAAILFMLLLASPFKWMTVGILTLALMAISCSSAILWSIYIPSLGKTGRVSSVNGVLDCAGYIAAAMANIVFSRLAGGIGWNTVIILWACIAASGALAAMLNKSNGNKLKEV